MAYTNPWDNSQPVGTDPAADLDTFIRNLKVDISDRMDDLVGVGIWADDLEDPKPIKPGYADIFVDVNASPPTIPDVPNDYPEKDGYLWYANDVRGLYVRDSAAWVLQNARHANYNADAPAGTRVSVERECTVISFLLSGTTTALGGIAYDLLEIDAAYAGWIIRAASATVENLVVAAPVTGPMYCITSTSIGTIGSFRVVDNGGNVVATTGVIIQVIVVASST
jgi:hypothetical protein